MDAVPPPIDKRARLKQWLASGEASLHALTFPQRELWETSPVPVGDMANHICCLIHVRGKITARDCQAALRHVVARQEVLRVSFLPGKDRPLQMIRATGEVNFRVRELSPAESHPAAVEEIAREIVREPFDLVQGPLYRIVLLQRAPDDFVLAFAIHHAVADGWTLGVFVQDLCGAYLQSRGNQDAPLPPVPLSYTAWGAAERAFWQPAELAPRAAFWKTRLAGAGRLWTPTDEARTSSAALHRWISRIPPELTKAARDLARRGGATLFSTLLTAFQITLAQWTGADDFVIGSPVANRNRADVKETMGYFSGIAPLRAQVDRACPFSTTLRNVHEATLDSFAHAMPFAELLSAVGERPAPGRHPIYQVRFALQNHPIPDVDLPGLSAKLRMSATGTARFDLGCEVTEEGDALEVVWLSRPHLVAQAEIENLDRMFQAILAAACRSPDSRTAALML
jgi:hypothetical protein